MFLLIIAAESNISIPQEVKRMLHRGAWCDAPACWGSRAAQVLSLGEGSSSCLGRRTDLERCVFLIESANTALAIVSDTGFEAAVRHLSKSFAVVAEQVNYSSAQHRDSWTPQGAPALQPFLNILPHMLRGFLPHRRCFQAAWGWIQTRSILDRVQTRWIPRLLGVLWSPATGLPKSCSRSWPTQ